MWYRITDAGQSSLSVGKHLISKDPRLSVAHYSFDHGLSPPKWDLYITDVRLSDSARYQCHVIEKNGHVSARSNVKLIVEGKQETDRQTDKDNHASVTIKQSTDRRRGNERVHEDNQLFSSLDVLVDIQPSDVLVSVGDRTQFSCNFTGQHRVRREQITWLKGKVRPSLAEVVLHLPRRWQTVDLRCHASDHVDGITQCHGHCLAHRGLSPE